MGPLENAVVLVTGATGFIGSHLVDRLVSMRARVRCLVRKSSSVRDLSGSGVELAYGDLVTGSGLREAAADARIVLHLAGATKARAIKDYYQGNVQATTNLLRACEETLHAPFRLVYVSSLAAMGPSPDGIPLTEDAAPRPVSHYGKSKLEAEQAVRTSPLSGQAVIVRPPVVFGPRDTDVYQVLRWARKGILIEIGGADSYFSSIYVKDLVEGLLAASLHPGAAGRTYFLSSADPVSWRGFAALASGLARRQVRVVRVPRRAATVIAWFAEMWGKAAAKPGIISRDKITEASHRFWTCTPERARRELSFRAATPLQEAVALTLAWYQEAGWLT